MTGLLERKSMDQGGDSAEGLGEEMGGGGHGGGRGRRVLIDRLILGGRHLKACERDGLYWVTWLGVGGGFSQRDCSSPSWLAPLRGQLSCPKLLPAILVCFRGPGLYRSRPAK